VKSQVHFLWSGQRSHWLVVTRQNSTYDIETTSKAPKEIKVKSENPKCDHGGTTSPHVWYCEYSNWVNFFINFYWMLFRVSLVKFLSLKALDWNVVKQLLIIATIKMLLSIFSLYMSQQGIPSVSLTLFNIVLLVKLKMLLNNCSFNHISLFWLQRILSKKFCPLTSIP
jgi:hypothetical protein